MSYHRPYDKQFSYVGSSNGLLFIGIYSFLMCIFDRSLYCIIQNITFGTFLIMDTDFSCQCFGFICINVCGVVFGSMYCISVGICKYHYLCFWYCLQRISAPCVHRRLGPVGALTST